jgi:hypothetical protein
VTLRPRCHPETAMRATYDREWEAVIMTCAACGQTSLTIAVARASQGDTGRAEQ